MKKQLIILAVAVVVLVVTSFAIVASANRKNAIAVAQSSEVQRARAAEQKAQATLKAHDQVNNANIKAAGDRIIELQNTNATLCAQVKAAKLVQPLCK